MMVPATEPVNRLPQTESLDVETGSLEIRNILVATDYSDAAHQALKAAIVIAGLYNSHILLAHASFLSNFAAGEGIAPPEFMVDQLAEDRKQMKELVANQAGLEKLTLDTVVEYADPVSFVRKLVKKQQN